MLSYAPLQILFCSTVIDLHACHVHPLPYFIIGQHSNSFHVSIELVGKDMELEKNSYPQI